MKKTYSKPEITLAVDFVRETRNSLGEILKPHWPYPEGQVYAYSPEVE